MCAENAIGARKELISISAANFKSYIKIHVLSKNIEIK
jgi:hypothetical protein